MMQQDVFISSFVRIRNGAIARNSDIVFAKEGGADYFFDAAYTNLQIQYHRFYKMDRLCKLAFLATEYLLGKTPITEKYSGGNTGVVVSTKNSSIDTDISFYKSMYEGSPSPSAFVYTLPNVMLGEICIRNHIKGESACLVFDIFEPSFNTFYADYLFGKKDIKALVVGWADFYNEKYDAFFYLLEQEKSELGLVHNEKTVNEIYNNR
jgi:hypothetical protein